VGASNHNDECSSFSSYEDGEYWVTSSAPGGHNYEADNDDGIYSTWPYGVSEGGGEGPQSDIPDPPADPTYYRYIAGTSMAAPIVAGIGGLVKSYVKGEGYTISPAMIRDVIESTTDGMQCNEGTYRTGSGRVNAYEALSLVQSVPTTPSGFYGTGGQGQNPTLHWDSVVEPDVNYLELKRTVTGQPGGNRVFTLSSSATQYTDSEIIIDKFSFATITYELRAVDIINQPSSYTNTVSYRGEGLWKQMTESIPTSFSLQGNYPNPFNPKTTIRIGLPEISSVTVTIYDLMGREVKTLFNGIENPGYKNIVWDSKDNLGKYVSSGMYF